MDVYIARQPIFDRQMRIFGYELLYRKSQNNFYEGTDDDEATVSLINNVFLVFGLGELVDRARGFINVSENLLYDEILLMLPKEQVVIELLEHIEPTEEVLAACAALKKKGYMLAMDDFVLEMGAEKYRPLIKLADIVKIEFPSVNAGNAAEMERLIAEYPRVSFLAEKVETREDFAFASKMGFQYFQGYFFSKPIMENAKDIGSLNANLILIFNELGNSEPDYNNVIEAIQRDVGLSYKLLKMANSVYYGGMSRIDSVKGMLVQIGTDEVRRWVQLMMLRGVQKPENAEVVKNSIVRAKMLSIIAADIGDRNESDYFMVGMFSSLDVLLNTTIEKAIVGLPFSDAVREALLGGEGVLRRHLDMVMSIERAEWDFLESGQKYGLSPERYMEIYMQALRWQQSMTL